MSSIADGSVCIQTSAEAQAATPSWLGEVALVASHLQKQEIFNKINERVRFARRRFGRYDVLDFLAVLFGYAISGERTLEAFYEAVHPFAIPFMALFGRASLPGGLDAQSLFSGAPRRTGRSPTDTLSGRFAGPLPFHRRAGRRTVGSAGKSLARL
ncbi:hypothetical protein KDAU_51330 [Dictyobacter aurantiacus]|uniref:Uncharacterized protein n=1 Tax=Dictyobacter aurantiacus TaxID=1936993 RepID=A0A401ZLV7_9CHLR|nr:hypothetical protein KDAU_51330 [Dictyobacter aurantiacus]